MAKCIIASKGDGRPCMGSGVPPETVSQLESKKRTYNIYTRPRILDVKGRPSPLKSMMPIELYFHNILKFPLFSFNLRFFALLTFFASPLFLLPLLQSNNILCGWLLC